MRRTILAGAALLITLSVAVFGTKGERDVIANDSTSGDQWEYLVVAAPSNTNFSASGNSSMRKEPSGAFGREAYVLESNLDKVGAKGWELVSITGGPSDPVYYFKRKRAPKVD